MITNKFSLRECECDSQAGFRPGVNTKHQLMRVLTPIEHAFHRRFTPVLVALDRKGGYQTPQTGALITSADHLLYLSIQL